jgi:hypothetical protein
MKITGFLIAATALTLAAPAHAQLLGGGLTGGLDRVLSGTLDSRINTAIERGVDNRTGRVGGRTSADGTVGGVLDGAASATAPNGKRVSGSKSVRAEKRVSQSAVVEADGPGTDDGRVLVGNVAGTAHGVLGAAAGTANGAATSAHKRVSGSASGSASGTGSTPAGHIPSSGTLAGSGSLTGSLAASGGSGDGFDVGMLVRDANGQTVGRVQAVREEARTVLVNIGNRTAELPAGSLAVDGDFAASTMTKAEIRKMARTPQASDAPRSN